MGFFTVEGELLEKWEIPTRRENNSENVLPDIAAAIDAKLAEKGIAKYKLHTLTNVNYDTIVKYCKGTIQRIPVEHLVLFCNVLDCNVEDIIEYAKQ